jgi:hypothetical protein
LGLGSDPTPGDPEVVRAGGNDYIAVADKIQRASSVLTALEAGASQAESTQALLDAKGDAVDSLGNAEARYRAAGQALVEYSHALDRVQAATYEALIAARLAQADADRADQDARRWDRVADDTTDPDQAGERARCRSRARECRADASSARRDVDSQREAAEQAQRERDAAAQRAIEEIESITAHDGLNDSWWDDWGAKIVDIIAEICEWISMIAGILALLVCWIPVIGQVLAGALLIIAAVTAIIAALANIALAATGKKSWLEAILSIVGAVLSCVGLGGAAKAGLAAFKSIMKTGNQMAAFNSAVKAGKATAGTFKAKGMGTFFMKVLMRPGAAARIAHGNTLGNIRGHIGEEIINTLSRGQTGKTFDLIDPVTKTITQVSPDGALRLLGPKTAARLKNLIPEGVLKFLKRPIAIGEAKNLRWGRPKPSRVYNSPGSMAQFDKYIALARQEECIPLYLFRNTNMIPGDALLLKVEAGEIKIITFEKFLGTKMDAWLQGILGTSVKAPVVATGD